MLAIVHVNNQHEFKVDFVLKYFIHTSKSVCPRNSNILIPSTADIDSAFDDPSRFAQRVPGTARQLLFTCPKCQEQYDSQYKWKQHIFLKHKDSLSCLGRRYQCEKCEKKLTAGNYLLHTTGSTCDESGYCNICSI